MRTTRFAPSPSGPLHLGHAYSALVAHDVARAGGGPFRLRIDDIDAARARDEYRTAIDVDLHWLGLVPDRPVWVQSHHDADYAAAVDRLQAMDLIYPCFCTRAQVVAQIAAAAVAPHGAADGIYPGTCRALSAATRTAWLDAGRAHAWRIDMTAAVATCGPLTWTDGDGAEHAAVPSEHGDIVITRRDGASAYHLASTVDDALMGISHVVRGADLLPATDIHRLLQALLGLPPPAYVHHRLVGNAAGVRLAKRDDAASIASLREAGVDPAQLIADLRAGQLPPGYRWVD